MAAKLARFSWLPGGLTAALVIAIGRMYFDSAPIELAAYDRATRVHETPADVALITIDDASLARLGPWPWSPEVHATLIDRLAAAGVRTIAFTVPIEPAAGTGERDRLRAALELLESSNLGGSEQARQLRRLLGGTVARDPNAQLTAAIAAHGNVVLPAELQPGARSTLPLDLPTRFFPEGHPELVRRAMSGALVRPPDAAFSEVAAAIGHTYVPADADGMVRTDMVAIRVGGALVPSLAIAVAARAAGVQVSELAFSAEGDLRLAGREVATTGGLRIHPGYAPPSGPGAFAQYPYSQALAGDVPDEELRGKTVLIGFMNTDAATGTSTKTTASEQSPLLVTIASAVAALQSGELYTRPAIVEPLEWVIAGAVVAYAAFALPAAGIAAGALASALIVAVLALCEFGLMSSAQVWIRLMLPCVALLAGLAVYLIGDLLRRANAGTAVRGEAAADAPANLRNLGQTFQRQGQLDLAFETYRRCPLDAPTMELLYNLGMDFERRAQLQKAASVYGYIATRDPNYRDLKKCRERVRVEPLTRSPAMRLTGSFEDAAVQDGPRSERTLGRYEIERELGKGAMGTVYLGRDPKINRVVAIKAIPLAEEFEEDDLAEARARFFREAEMAGRLNHPAIVTVYDAGEDQGLAYIAMEYLRGRHLSDFTDSKQLLPFRTVLLLTARVADALDYAHRQNVVHRDIKPANIMFDPDTDELKITDFGIARLTDTSRTKTGIVLGTPSFMSPEQLEGRPLDGRSDQFALGVSLYQLLCGQLPFRAESMPRLMQKIATEPHTSVRLIRPELPASIDRIIERVLSKSADDRYATCADLAAALRACAGPEQATRQLAAAGQPAHEWLIP